jgi:hypothetical protein
MVVSALLVVITILSLHNGKVVDAADNLVLLEKRHPGYWDYLSPKKALDVETLEELEGISESQIIENNLFQDLIQEDVGGVQISSDNGNMHFSGTANEDIWPALTNTIPPISTGTYYMSIGQDYPDDFLLYFEGFNDHGSNLIDMPSKSKIFYLDSSQYKGYRLTAYVPKDKSVDFTIVPLLVKISDDDISSQVRHLRVWRNINNEALTDFDWTLFYRRLDNEPPELSYCLINEDGNGKKIENGISTTVEMDRFGRE